MDTNEREYQQAGMWGLWRWLYEPNPAPSPLSEWVNRGEMATVQLRTVLENNSRERTQGTQRKEQ